MSICRCPPHKQQTYLWMGSLLCGSMLVWLRACAYLTRQQQDAHWLPPQGNKSEPLPIIAYDRSSAMFVSFRVCSRQVCTTVPQLQPVPYHFTYTSHVNKDDKDIHWVTGASEKKNRQVAILPPYATHGSWLLLTIYSVLSNMGATLPITVAAWCKAWTVFDRSNTGIEGSNPTRGMGVSVSFFCLFCSLCRYLCVGSGLVTGWSPVQEVLPTA
jgi:hypothetical protein